MADYVTLANSNTSLSKRFRSVSLTRVNRRAQEERRTLSGKMDASFGGMQGAHRLKLFVPEVSSDANYGTRAELETLFALVDPGATPSSFVRYTDYWGVLHAASLLKGGGGGELSFEPLGTLVGVSGAWYMVDVEVSF